MEPLPLSALYVNYALKQRDLPLNTPSSIRAGILYHTTGYRWTVLAAGIILMLLAFFEAGQVPFVVRMVDGALLSFCLLDMVLRRVYLGRRRFWACGSSWNVIRLTCILLLLLNFILVLITGQAEGIALSSSSSLTGIPYVARVLRPLLVIERMRDVRNALQNLLSTVSRLATVIALLLLAFMATLLFAVVGYISFSGLTGMGASSSSCSVTFNKAADFCSTVPYTSACRDFFNSVDSAFMHLFELLCAANFPLVAVPAVRCFPLWAGLFFACYIALIYYLLLNIMLAVTYEAFRSAQTDVLSKSYQGSCESLARAYLALCSAEGAGGGAARGGDGSGPGIGSGSRGHLSSFRGLHGFSNEELVAHFVSQVTAPAVEVQTGTAAAERRQAGQQEQNSMGASNNNSRGCCGSLVGSFRSWHQSEMERQRAERRRLREKQARAALKGRLNHQSTGTSSNNKASGPSSGPRRNVKPALAVPTAGQPRRQQSQRPKSLLSLQGVAMEASAASLASLALISRERSISRKQKRRVMLASSDSVSMQHLHGFTSLHKEDEAYLGYDSSDSDSDREGEEEGQGVDADEEEVLRGEGSSSGSDDEEEEEELLTPGQQQQQQYAAVQAEAAARDAFSSSEEDSEEDSDSDRETQRIVRRATNGNLPRLQRSSSRLQLERLASRGELLAPSPASLGKKETAVVVVRPAGAGVEARAGTPVSQQRFLQDDSDDGSLHQPLLLSEHASNASSGPALPSFSSAAEAAALLSNSLPAPELCSLLFLLRPDWEPSFIEELVLSFGRKDEQALQQIIAGAAEELGWMNAETRAAFERDACLRSCWVPFTAFCQITLHLTRLRVKAVPAQKAGRGAAVGTAGGAAATVGLRVTEAPAPATIASPPGRGMGTGMAKAGGAAAAVLQPGAALATAPATASASFLSASEGAALLRAAGGHMYVEKSGTGAEGISIAPHAASLPPPFPPASSPFTGAASSAPFNNNREDLLPGTGAHSTFATPGSSAAASPMILAQKKAAFHQRTSSGWLNRMRSKTESASEGAAGGSPFPAGGLSDTAHSSTPAADPFGGANNATNPSAAMAGAEVLALGEDSDGEGYEDEEGEDLLQGEQSTEGDTQTISSAGASVHAGRPGLGATAAEWSTVETSSTATGSSGSGSRASRDRSSRASRQTSGGSAASGAAASAAVPLLEHTASDEPSAALLLGPSHTASSLSSSSSSSRPTSSAGDDLSSVSFSQYLLPHTPRSSMQRASAALKGRAEQRAVQVESRQTLSAWGNSCRTLRKACRSESLEKASRCCLQLPGMGKCCFRVEKTQKKLRSWAWARWLAESKPALAFFDLMICLNILLVVAILSYANDEEDPGNIPQVVWMRYLQLLTLAIFAAETFFKAFYFGCKVFLYSSVFNGLDCFLLTIALFGAVYVRAVGSPESLFELFSYPRFFRILRVLSNLPHFDVSFLSLLDIQLMFAEYGFLLLSSLYAFSIAGIAGFAGRLSLSIPAVANSSYNIEGAYALNYDDLPSALLCSFNILFMTDFRYLNEGLSASLASSSPRLFFSLFWAVHNLLLLFVAISFLLDTYTLRSVWRGKQKAEKARQKEQQLLQAQGQSRSASSSSSSAAAAIRPSAAAPVPIWRQLLLTKPLLSSKWSFKQALRPALLLQDFYSKTLAARFPPLFDPAQIKLAQKG